MTKTPERTLTSAQLSAQQNKSTHKLSPDQKADMYSRMCQAFSVPEDIVPFEYLRTGGGSEVLYASARCTAYLIGRDKLTTRIVEKDIIDDMVIFIVEVGDGKRSVQAVGAVPLKDGQGKPLKSEKKSNKVMHAHTKATRRGVLAFCGMGILDESEIEGIPNVVGKSQPTSDKAVKKAKAFVKKIEQNKPQEEPPKESPLEQVKRKQEAEAAEAKANPVRGASRKLLNEIIARVNDRYHLCSTQSQVPGMIKDTFGEFADRVNANPSVEKQWLNEQARELRNEYIMRAENEKPKNEV